MVTAATSPWLEEDALEELEYQEYDFDAEFMSGDFVPDLVALAEQYVDSWFANKITHDKKLITCEELHDPRRISMVLNTDICTAVDKAYKELEKKIDPIEIERSHRFGFITEDIKFVQDTFLQMSRMTVPKEFAGGILLMHLEFCCGFNFPEDHQP